jgi:hypothetical protein
MKEIIAWSSSSFYFANFSNSSASLCSSIFFSFDNLCSSSTILCSSVANLDRHFYSSKNLSSFHLKVLPSLLSAENSVLELLQSVAVAANGRIFYHIFFN